MFFNEVELLDLRLRTLDSIVDYFVIAETNITHTGKPKPYYFDYFKFQFKKYDRKIIHVKVPLEPNINPWIVENAHRDLIGLGIKDAGPEDYIIISDADEIPNPKAVLCGIDLGYEQFGLLQKLFYYYVNCQAVQMWYGSMVWKRKHIPSPQYVRNRRGGDPHGMENGGWHYSFLGGAEKIMLKLHSFSEQQVNTPDVNNEENIKRCLESGEDIFHRTENWAQKRFITDDEIDHTEVIEWAKEYPNFKK
jgi:beta-1,4-mannosyl-glycoprotein beta-1,4-N-acetylglucosaminyltransferase